MKKTYLKPETEKVVASEATSLLRGSYLDHADSKGTDFFDDENTDDGNVAPRNLWED